MSITSIGVGAIIPVIGVFNSFGDYIETGIHPLPDWLKECDGTLINDVDSSLHNTYIPNLIGAVPVGSVMAGTEMPQRFVAQGIYAFGENNPQETLSNTERIFTARFFMRIK